MNWSLRAKCPNTAFFLVRRDTEYLSVLNPNTGKYGPEKNPYFLQHIFTFQIIELFSRYDFLLKQTQHLLGLIYFFIAIRINDIRKESPEVFCKKRKWL